MDVSTGGTRLGPHRFRNVKKSDVTPEFRELLEADWKTIRVNKLNYDKVVQNIISLLQERRNGDL